MNILVTGASNGIGNQLVRILCLNSDNSVVGIARSSEKLNRLASEINDYEKGGKFYPISFDLSSNNISNLLIPEVLQFIPTVDVLINNAGLLINKPFAEMTDEDFDSMFNINVKASFKLVRDLLPYFSKNAHIVNISSMGGYQGSAKFNGLSLYSASKAALAVLSECLALELGEKQISVNALALGAAQTEMLHQAFPGYKAPLSALEMATFIADFATSGHKYFNGKILPVSVSTP